MHLDEALTSRLKGKSASRIAVVCRFTWGRPDWVSDCLLPMMPRRGRIRAAQGDSATLRGSLLEVDTPAEQQACDQHIVPVRTW